jgi:hypothetical protein
MVIKVMDICMVQFKINIFYALQPNRSWYDKVTRFVTCHLGTALAYHADDEY